jgi:hypothetical protein
MLPTRDLLQSSVALCIKEIALGLGQDPVDVLSRYVFQVRHVDNDPSHGVSRATPAEIAE